MKNFLLITTVLLLTACATTSEMLTNSQHIKAGMTGKEVIALLGEPQNVQFKGKSNEAWQYCTTGTFDPDRYVLLFLVDGLVDEKRTYRNTLTGFCESFFRTVNWTKPD